MMTVIEVQCPHCGARGQMMVPPVGSLFIGPCSRCEDYMIVFCGQALALDGETMGEGTGVERREHVLDTITRFLDGWLDRVMGGGANDEIGDASAEEPAAELDEPDFVSSPEDKAVSAPISDLEFCQFVENDLELLDDRSYFDSIFKWG